MKTFQFLAGILSPGLLGPPRRVSRPPAGPWAPSRAAWEGGRDRLQLGPQGRHTGGQLWDYLRCRPFAFVWGQLAAIWASPPRDSSDQSVPALCVALEGNGPWTQPVLQAQDNLLKPGPQWEVGSQITVHRCQCRDDLRTDPRSSGPSRLVLVEPLPRAPPRPAGEVGTGQHLLAGSPDHGGSRAPAELRSLVSGSALPQE